MNTRYLGLALLHLILLFFIYSCERSDHSAKGQKNENILRFDVNLPITSFNPAEVESSGSSLIFPLLYSYLFVPDESGKLQPDLASGWTYSPDTMTFMIHLKEKALFHDNRPVTAHDVKYSFDLLLKNVRPSAAALVDKILSPSDYVIQIVLQKDDPEFLHKIWDMEILQHDDTGEMDFWNKPVGSGPFRFKYRNGEQEVFLEADEHYFNGRPSLDGILFACQPDKEKSWARVLSGATDIAPEISPKNYEMMQLIKEKYYFDLYPLEFYSILLYNTTDPLFSDPLVRTALSHAINRNFIVDHILKGFGKVANGVMGVDSPYHNPDVSPVIYNVKTALALLKRAGWHYDAKGQYLEKQGRPFAFTLFYLEESRTDRMVAQYIQLCFNEMGIKTRPTALPFSCLQKAFVGNNEFQTVLTEIVGAYRNPEYLRELWSPELGKRSMAGAFEAAEVSHLFNEFLNEKSPEKQKEIYYRIDALMTSLQPGAFLFQKTAIDVMTKRFKIQGPFSLTHEGIYRLQHAVLNRE